jgi:O-antigen/teichoic acid export membrane protein
MLAMTGNQRIVMVATATAALLGVVVALLLVSRATTPEGRIAAAAIGMASGIFAENASTLLAVRRRLGFWPYDATWLKPLAAGLLAAAVTYAAGLFLDLSAIPTIALLGTVLGTLYLALLLLFGLSTTDKEFLGEFWNVAKRVLRRGGNARA